VVNFPIAFSSILFLAVFLILYLERGIIAKMPTIRDIALSSATLPTDPELCLKWGYFHNNVKFSLMKHVPIAVEFNKCHLAGTEPTTRYKLYILSKSASILDM